MKRKDYQKPAMQIVAIVHRSGLLAGSGEGEEVEDYNRRNSEDW